MARWFPDPIWMDEPCYIIGGGPSLHDFPWESLCGRNVLGCNAAFYIGASLVPITLFGDAQFLRQHRQGLDGYAVDGGWVVTCSNRVQEPPDYLKVMKKVLRGLGTDALGWNGNTGASAINLALLLGADPIYLLGFDMQLSPDGKRKNFHNAYNDKPHAKVYGRFLQGMSFVSQGLRDIFPGRVVINLEDGTSALDEFPKESLKAHFQEVKACVTM